MFLANSAVHSHIFLRMMAFGSRAKYNMLCLICSVSSGANDGQKSSNELEKRRLSSTADIVRDSIDASDDVIS